MKMSVTIKKQIKWYESFGNLKKKKNRTEKSVTHLHLGYCVHLWSLHLKGDIRTETDSEKSTTDGQRHRA